MCFIDYLRPDLRSAHFIKSASPTRALSNIVFIIQAGAVPQLIYMALSTQAVVFSKMLKTYNRRFNIMATAYELTSGGLADPNVAKTALEEKIPNF